MSKFLNNVSKKKLDDFNKWFDTIEKTKDDKPEFQDRYLKYLVIKMLIDGRTYKEITEKTGYKRSTIPVIEKRFLNDTFNFYKDGRSKKSILEKNSNYIESILKKNQPKTINDLCNIILNDKNFQFKFCKSTMWDFLNRHDLMKYIVKETKFNKK